MRIAESVLLTCWPPAPEARKVSILRSAGLISTSSISSSSGRIATVAAEVWMRPCDSVAGTRCTRCVPDSNLSCEYAPRALDARHDFLVAAVFAGVSLKDFDVPAAAFGVAQIHAEQVAGEDRRFVAAGAGAHFEDTGWLRRADLSAAAATAVRRPGRAGAASSRAISSRAISRRSGSSSMARVRPVRARLRRARCSEAVDRFELRVFARELAEAVVVGMRVGLRQQQADFLVALGQGFELAADRWGHGRARGVASDERAASVIAAGCLARRPARPGRSAAACSRSSRRSARFAQARAGRVQQFVGQRVGEIFQRLVRVTCRWRASRARLRQHLVALAPRLLREGRSGWLSSGSARRHAM